MPASSPVPTVVDTDVVSNLLLPAPDPVVAAWFAAQPRSDLHITTITEAELFRGAETMDKGKRRDRLFVKIETIIEETFGGRVLHFDRQAARMFALVAADRKAADLHIHFADSAIAAIARLHNMAVATHNTDDFVSSGIELIDPWEAAG